MSQRCFIREIHLSDLIRAHEGNSDYYEDDPAKIHWAKFNMMGRFIDAITNCQKACRESGMYDFKERPHVNYLLHLMERDVLMNVDVRHHLVAIHVFIADESSRCNALDLHPRLKRG